MPCTHINSNQADKWAKNLYRPVDQPQTIAQPDKSKSASNRTNPFFSFSNVIIARNTHFLCLASIVATLGFLLGLPSSDVVCIQHAKLLGVEGAVSEGSELAAASA